MSPRAEQLKTPSTYVSGWHAGPTPQRCSGSITVNDRTTLCAHPSHREPQEQPAVTTVVEAAPQTTTTTAPQTLLVPDLDEAKYHRHSALSSSGAKQLLANPARFRWIREHGQAPKKAFDFGSLAHRKVLGKGAEIVVVEADTWQTKAAREQRDEARAAGLIPALTKDVAQANAMAEALLLHPAARELFERGVAEQSMFWTDPATGVQMRARSDWWRAGLDGARGIVGDYKTAATSVDPRNVPRIIHSWGYHLQADWYCRGVRALGLDEDPIFLFVLQEKTEPYPVTVVELDEEALRVGREQSDRALALFRECTEAGVWPSYSDVVEVVSLPGYAIADHDRQPRPDTEENYAYDPDEPDPINDEEQNQ